MVIVEIFVYENQISKILLSLQEMENPTNVEEDYYEAKKISNFS
jgi:hypothetical protein